MGRRLGGGAQIKGRRTIGIGKGIEMGFGRAVRGRGDGAVAVSGGHAAEQEEGAAPAGIAPGVGHHGAIPLLEDLGMAARAERGIIDGGPFVFIGRRVGLSLSDIVGGGFRDAIGELAMAGMPRRSPEYHNHNAIYQRTQPVIHAHATPLSLACHAWECLPLPCVDNISASPDRDAIVQDLARRHTERVSFEQGPMTSVRVELWGSHHHNGRYWAGLLHRYLLAVEFFLPMMYPFTYNYI